MIKVWDSFVRISHWLVALLIPSAWLSANYGDAEFLWHSWNGYALFILVFSRVIWAFIGSTTAKFSHFITSPIVSVKYIFMLLTGKSPNYMGHNPAGGWMIIIIWLTILAQATTGLFSSDDILVEGPLIYLVTEETVSSMTSWHHIIFTLLLGLVALHIIAVIYHQLIKKEKIVQAMLHGKKQIIANGQINSDQTNKQETGNYHFKPFYLAIIVTIVIAFVFFGLKDYLINL